MEKKRLALFDFDGTISSKDSFVEFMKFYVGKPKFYTGLILMSPLVALYLLKILPNTVLKETFLSWFFKNTPQKVFQEKATAFSLSMDSIIKKSAMDKITWHKNQNHRIIIVSASIDYWLKPWCDSHNLELICSQMESKNGKITGKLSSKNCFGPEKTNRINESLHLKDYEFIYAYGDSSGDKEMLALADEPHMRVFD